MKPGPSDAARPAGAPPARPGSPTSTPSPRTVPADWPAGACHSLEVRGQSFDLIECGEGPPLVMLPPMPGWKEAYVGLAPRLAKSHRVLTFDLRRQFDGPATWDALVADCEAIAGARVGGPVTVLGHSLGGALAMQWALAHPERVRALVVSSAFARVFTPRRAWVARWIEQPMALAGMRWLPDGLSSRYARHLARHRRWVFDAHGSPDVVERVRRGVRDTPLSLLRQRIALAMRLDLRERLLEIRCPVLLLRAELDTPFAIEATEEIAQRIPGPERRVLPDVGHLHPLSSPELLADVTSRWLEGLESEAG